MRRIAWVLLLVACTSPGTTDPDSDAGELDVPDASSCANPGPLGTCLDGVDAGATCSNDRCVESDACCNGLMCIGEAQTLCGTCMRTPDECDLTDRPCDPGSVCHVRPAPACSCDGSDVRVCGAPCPGTPCGDDERCTDDGRCVIRLCTEGFACPAGRVCNLPRGDDHGCAFARCEDDGDCTAGRVCRHSTGECVLPGFCSPPPP